MGFSVSNGQIIGPNGQPFIAAGVDIWSNEVINDPTGSANLIESLFPNANMVRIAAGDGYSTDSVAALEPFINQMTSKGIVVEIGNYNPALTSNVATGQALTDELAWFTSLATAFKGNPYVWFSTDNEPSDQYNYSGATSAEQLAVYNTIRATGNTSMIGLENSQWSLNGQQSFSASISASDIAGMTNVHWDDHYYNWLSNYSTDVGANLSALQAEVAGSQVYKDADGTIPAIIGEYGPATTGNGTDPGGSATITAVLESGYGSTAWGINSGGTGDQLVNGNSLTAFGQQVATAETSPVVAPPPPPPLLPPSPNGTTTTTASGSPIVDAAGRSWTLVQSASQGLQTAINGTVDTTTANVVLLETLNGNMIQENTAGNWYSEPGTGGAWTQIAAPVAPPGPSASGTEITTTSAKPIIDQSGNAWTLVQSATNGLQIAVNGTVDAPTANVVLLETLNGAMYQENAAGNWYSETTPNDSWALIANPNPPPPPPATVVTGNGSDSLVLSISEDAYANGDGTSDANGDAAFTVSVDGKQLAGTFYAAASHSAGASQNFTLKGDWAPGAHSVTVAFLNDAWGGTASTDRNLYVNDVTYDGTDTKQSAALYSTGSQTFSVTDSTAIPPVVTGGGSDSLVVKVSEDYYLANAQFTVSVDGKQLGGTFTATTMHTSGNSQTFAFAGDFGSGQHTVSVNFLNDAYAGTPATDRNLYVNDIVYNGTDTGQSAALMGQGAKTFSVSGGTTPSVSETGDHGSLAKNLSQTGSYTVGGDTFVLGSGNAGTVALGAGTSQIKFVGPSSVTLTGGSGQATVTADAGNNKFVAGAGSLDVTGGAGKDAYVFHSTSGLLTLEDFSLAKGDTLTVDKTLQGSLHEASDAKGGTMLTFGTNTSHGVDIHGLAALPSSNVVWA
jgi:Ca-dependent carbohydrate-binding module xylan-binding/Cellulase (glycosyl hydrolase family 5)